MMTRMISAGGWGGYAGGGAGVMGGGGFPAAGGAESPEGGFDAEGVGPGGGGRLGGEGAGGGVWDGRVCWVMMTRMIRAGLWVDYAGRATAMMRGESSPTSEAS